MDANVILRILDMHGVGLADGYERRPVFNFLFCELPSGTKIGPTNSYVEAVRGIVGVVKEPLSPWNLIFFFCLLNVYLMLYLFLFPSFVCVGVVDVFLFLYERSE